MGSGSKLYNVDQQINLKITEKINIEIGIFVENSFDSASGVRTSNLRIYSPVSCLITLSTKS